MFADCNDVVDGVRSCSDLEQKRKGRDETKHLKGMALDVYSALAHSDHYSTAEAILRINNWQKSNITSSVDVEVIFLFL